MQVLQGEADATFGLEAVAQPFGLAFVPVIDERFDILVCRRAWFEPPLQKLVAFARSETFLAKAGRLAGYDVTRLGEVVWNA